MKKALIGLALVTANIAVYAADDIIKQNNWIWAGKEAVKSKLKDPDSAQFKNSYFNRSTTGVPVSCGLVNSKNGFGGYGGFQRYVSAASPELTFLEEQVADFQLLWNRYCTVAK